MQVRPIRSDADYRGALRRIEVLMDMNPDAGTAEDDELDILATLVEAYEARHYPMELPDPIEAIKFYMEQNQMTAKDLQPMIGRLNRVYEVLNHTRPLTLTMIRKLHGELGIPADSLIREPVRQSV